MKNFKKRQREKKIKLIIFLVLAILTVLTIATTNLYKVFAVDLKITLTPRPAENNIHISWNADEVAQSGKKYRVWQKRPGNTQWGTIGVLNYEEGETMKVLNVYPESSTEDYMPSVTFNYTTGGSATLPKAASLKVWMEGGTTSAGESFIPYGKVNGTGKQLIYVTEVGSQAFNANPNMIWNYDVTMFGTWNANGDASRQPNNAAIQVIEQYINAGYGVFSGHDTIGYGYNTVGLSKLRKYFNIATGYFLNGYETATNVDYQDSWGYASNYVQVLSLSADKGNLTKFPWDITGKRLTVPLTHTCSNAAKGNVWMDLVNGSALGRSNQYLNESVRRQRGGDPYYYLTTWNNTAMIQTGHSDCKSTPDECKVLANTLYYLKQITEGDHTLDHSAEDWAAPNVVSTDETKYEFSANPDGTVQFNYQNPGDNGSTYYYYVENVTDKTRSAEQSSTITTGVKGYAYVIDQNPSTTNVGTTVMTSGTSLNIGTIDPSKEYWVHMRTIDGAGNYSGVTHFKVSVPQAVITLHKTDSVTHANLPGATFGLLEWNGSTYVRKSTLTDNNDGSYTSELISYTATNKGKFRIVEEKQPNHYYAQNWYQEVVLVQPGIIQLSYSLTNVPYPRAVITVNKTDNVTNARLSGAIFGLYEWDGSKYVKKHTLTDKGNGVYATQEIEYSPTNQGKFKIVEERAPEHYYGYDDRDDKKYRWEKEFVLSDPGYHEYSYDMTNTPYPKAVITLNKTDNVTGEALKGAIFGLYEWDGSKYVKRHTLTDRNNGSYITQEIEYSATNLGKFKIVEERAPEHYFGYDDRDDKKYRWEKEIVLSDPGYHEYSYSLTNTPYPRSVITIHKTDSVTGEPLDQAIFGLYEWNGSDYARRETLTDHHDGSYTTSLIEYSATNLGKFKIVEEQAPLYYTNPRKDIVFTLTEPGYHEYSYDVQNEPNKVKINITKVDSETLQKIKGAIFTVYTWDVASNRYIEYQRDGKTMTLTFQEGDRTYISDWLYSNRTNLGKFRIVETGTPDGYFGDWSNLGNREKVNNDIVIDLNNNGQTLVLKNNNSGAYTNKRVKGTINVNKIDKDTNKYLPQGDATLDGAVYGLYAAETINHKDTVSGKLYDPDQLVQRQTIVKGKLVFDNVEIGNYYIKEIKAPEGYIVDDKKYEINMNYEGEAVEHLTREATLVEQVKKQAFTVQKLSENDSSTEPLPLEKSGFKVYLIKDLALVKNGTIKPDSNGRFNAEDFLEYDFSNELTALDYSENQDGERIPELFSDEKGRITSPELAYGQYIVKETTVPTDRYEVEPFVVDIRDDNRKPQNYRYMADPEFEAYIKINKFDSSTNKKVLNKTAGYRIWDVTEEKYVTYIVQYPKPTEVGTEENPFRISENGYFTTPFKLQLGEYELREVEAPEGYVKQGSEGTLANDNVTSTPKDPVRFKIKMNTAYYQDEETDSLVIEVNQYNDPMLGEVKVVKQGEFLAGTTQKEDGRIEFNYELRPIQGAEFEVYAKEDILTQDNQGTLLYEEDEKIGTIVTNTQGIGYLNNLPIGKYYVKETKAGEGFVLNREVKSFEITYQGEEQATQSVQIDYKNERQKIKVNGNGKILIEKIADKKVYKPGEDVNYKIKVSNSSDRTITDIIVKDSKVNGVFDDIYTDNVSKVDDTTIKINKLDAGEYVELRYKATLGELEEDEDKVKLKNVVSATGKTMVPDPNDPNNPDKVIEQVVETEDDEDVYVTDKNLIVIKEALKDQYEPGQVAQYLIHVINNGKTNIVDVDVEETLLDGQFVELERLNINGREVKYAQNEDGTEDRNKVNISLINPGEEVLLRYEYHIPEEYLNDSILTNKVKAKGKVEKPNPDDPDHPIYEDVEDEDDEEITVKEDNINLGIMKKDAETGEGVEGAVIGLFAEEDIKAPDGTVLIKKDTLIEKTVTDKDGVVKFKADLPLGVYYVKELEAPSRYYLSDEKIVFDATYRGQNIEYILESHIITDRSVNAEIAKKDSEGNFLPGAELEVVDEDGNVIKTFTTTDKVQAINRIEKGKIYTLREKTAPTGYTTAPEIKFYIGNDEKLYQRIENAEGYLTETVEVANIEMIDEKTKIVVDVVDKETKKHIPGIEVEIKDKVTGETVYSFVTGEEPDVIEGLPVGDYEIETKDPQNRGYITEHTEIEVKDSREDQKFVVEQDYTKVEISLKDEETKEQLPGGTIQLLDEYGNVVREINTEEEPDYFERLPVGKYTLHQTKAPEGYWPSEDIEIEVKDTSEVQRFEMLNRRKIFNMSLEKKLIKQVYNGTETNVGGELSKFEIRPQNIGEAEFWTIYIITVRNTGELEGKATIKESVPDGFEMYQESNLAWKVEGNEATLTTDVIAPGESREYEVSLRWKGHVTNIGMKENRASITSTDNNVGFGESNMDDNSGSARILIALSTGLDPYYENIIIASFIIVIIGVVAIIIIKNRIRK